MYRHITLLSLTVVVALGATACGKDPEVAKREFVQSGDAFVEQEKFAEAIVEYRNAVQQDPRFGEARSKLAAAYQRTGDLPNAYREAVRAADLLPDDAAVQIRAGELLLAARQFDQALARADRALAVLPRSVEAQILRANALAGLNNLDEAVAEIEEAIRTDPERTASYASLGMMQLVRGDREQAEAAFRTAVDLAPQSIEARLALANYYWRVGKASDAEEQFKAALTIEPANRLANRALSLFYIGSRRPKESEPYLKSLADTAETPTSRLMLADYYIGMHRLEEARALLNEIAASEGEGYVEANLRLAGMGLATGDLAASMVLVENALAKDPRNQLALLGKADLLARMGKLDEALAAVRSAIAVNPQSAAAQYALGKIQMARHQETAAIDAFTQTLKLDPRRATAEVALAQLHLGANRLDAAESFARAAISKISGYLEAHLILARINLMKGNVAGAEPSIRGLARLMPESAAVRGLLGQLELLERNRPAARRAFLGALETNPLQIDALAGLVTMDIQDERTGEARSRIDDAIRQAPANAQVLMLAANTYVMLNDAPAVEAAARRVLEIDPNEMDAYSLLGRAYIAQRRIDEAVTLFSQMAEKDPNALGARTMLGMLLQMQNKPAEARAQYERALAIEPRAAVAANNLAMLYADSNEDLGMALQLAQTAKATLPNEPSVDDTLGWVQYRRGNSSLAIGSFEAAARARPENATYQYHLGLAYKEMGDAAKARASFEKALALSASFDGSDDARQQLAGLEP